MKQISILHLGIGQVGKVVVAQVMKQNKKVKKDLGISLEYVGKFNSKSQELDINRSIEQVELPFILIDTTASDKTYPYIVKALKRGGYVILANKKPLARSQQEFDLLNELGGEKLLFETTVGAGLPLLGPLQDFIKTGDRVIEIQGSFSGTLGFLFSQLERGALLSEAVLKAKAYGLSEPNPKDDLSGMDVARKALILARLMGQKIEMNQISLEALFPKSMRSFCAHHFLEQISDLDEDYKYKVKKAAANKKVLRYVAHINHICQIGIQEVDPYGELGRLSGTDNIFVIKTERYFNNPLVIKGPGAGIEVTAAGVFGDLLSVVRREMV